jgi:hypothetical protein
MAGASLTSAARIIWPQSIAERRLKLSSGGDGT